MVTPVLRRQSWRWRCWRWGACGGPKDAVLMAQRAEKRQRICSRHGHGAAACAQTLRTACTARDGGIIPAIVPSGVVLCVGPRLCADALKRTEARLTAALRRHRRVALGTRRLLQVGTLQPAIGRARLALRRLVRRGGWRARACVHTRDHRGDANDVSECESSVALVRARGPAAGLHTMQDRTLHQARVFPRPSTSS